MAEEGYVVANSNYELIDGGLYVVVNGSYQAVTEAYVVKNGVYERFYTAERLKGISENLSFSESIEVTVLKSFSDSLSLSESMGKFEEDRDHIKGLSETLSFSDSLTLDVFKEVSFSDSISLSESMGKFETSDGPSNLSATWDAANCGMDLDWTADTVNSQDIYRCTGSTCNPSQDGTKIDTVSAGTNHYDDGDGTNTVPEENGGDYTYEIVTSAGETNADTGTAGTCTN